MDSRRALGGPFGLRSKSLILKDFLQLAERVETDLGAYASELIEISGATSPSDTPIDTPEDAGSRWLLAAFSNARRHQRLLAQKLRETKFASKMLAWKT